jgi:hypothetical protein
MQFPDLSVMGKTALLLGGLLAIGYGLLSLARDRGYRPSLARRSNQYVALSEAARLAFEQSRAAHSYDVTSEDRLHHHIVIMALEARHHPDRFGLYGSVPPSTTIERIPTEQVNAKTIARDGSAIGRDLFNHPDRVEWSPLFVRKPELTSHIERLKKGSTYGQSPA